MKTEIQNLRSNKDETKKTINALADSFDLLQGLSEQRMILLTEIKESFNDYVDGLIENAESTIDYSPAVNKNNMHISFNEDNYDLKTVEGLYKLIRYMPIYNRINDLLQTYDNNKTLINNANKLCSNGISWFFVGDKDREKAYKSFQQIKQILNDGYSEKVRSLASEYKGITTEQALSSFCNQTNDYLFVLGNIVEEKVYADKDPQIPDIRKVRGYINEYRRVNRELNSLLNSVDEIKNSVIEKSYLIAEKEAKSILNNVSVDELNREKKGIRTSLLKSAGYESVTDILNASFYKLSSIYGISENNAYTIKKAAEKMNQDTLKNVKIKINSDNKTKEATDLLKALYRYSKNKDIVDIANKVKDQYYDKLVDYVDELANYDDQFKLLYATYEKKKYVAEGLEFFKRVEANNYKGIVSKLSSVKTRLDRVDLISDEVAWNFFTDDPAGRFAMLDDLTPGLFGNSDTFYGLPEDLAEQIKDECIFPDGLLVNLRRYQEWGVKYALHQKKVLLGDEMGLGKTIQAIATMVSLKNTGATHFIVVCPASVTINWCREVEQRSKLKATKVHGSGRKNMFKYWLKYGGVAVTTYESAGVFELPEDFTYSLLVVDEAHYVKNPDAARTQRIIKLKEKTDRVLYMTGTALENKVDEMVELIDQLQPNVANEAKNIAFMSSAELFRQKVAPVYYRRKREDVLTELPELIETDAWCSLNEEEKTKYENNILSTNRNYMAIRRVSFDIDDLKYSSKAQRLKELVEEAKQDGRKVIVFSFFLETIDKIFNYFHDICLFPITGALTPQKRQEIIDEFDNSPPGTMLVSQIQAGGTGLNIQSASVVIITEPQWKPSIENQAISRAYRMGQSRNVLVYRLLCENTVDEKIRDLLRSKQEIFDAFADKSVAAEANAEIDNKTFGDIIKEEIDRINKERNEATYNN